MLLHGAPQAQRCAMPGPSQRLLAACQRRSPAPSSLTRRDQLVVQAFAQEQPAAALRSQDEAPPPGCSRYTVRLRKPLGIVLEEERGSGRVTVAELVPEGAAACSGEVGIGDELIACSGRAFTSEAEYQGNVVRQGEVMVRVSVRSESFDTVMAAISSHPANLPVTLEFQRCERPPPQRR